MREREVAQRSETEKGLWVCACVCVFGERGLFMVVSSRFVSLGQSGD